MKKNIDVQKTFFRNKVVTKRYLSEILFWCFSNFGMEQAGFLADSLKELGFYFSTYAGISIAIEDLKVPPLKTKFLKNIFQEIEKDEIKSIRGELTELELYLKLIDKWTMSSKTLKTQVVDYLKNFDPLNPIYIMAFSGARGNLSQVLQLLGMRGLMAGPTGGIIDIPITKNFREGLTITDYMISAYGARKGLVDTSLKTADSGYLTRRLIDVAQDVLIREIDCYTNRGIVLFNSEGNNNVSTSFKERLIGRILAKDIFYFNSKEIFAKKNQPLNSFIVKKIEEQKFPKILIRSPLTCELSRSVCQNCYGWNLSHGKLVDLGEAIGIIAAQSIGEPGTQLTMRTFHTGGVFQSESSGNIFSKLSGQIILPSNRKFFKIRTSQGRDGVILEVPTNIQVLNFKNKISTISVDKDTILLIKDKEFIRKNQVIASVLNTQDASEKKEKKIVFSTISGEVLLKKSDSENNSSSNLASNSENNLIWILSGNVFNIPYYAKINQYKFSNLKPSSSIAKIKFIAYKSGIIKIDEFQDENQQNSYDIKLLREQFSLKNSQLYTVFDKKEILIENDEENNLVFKEEKTPNIIMKLNTNKFFYLKRKLNFNLEKSSIIGELINTKYRTKVNCTIYPVPINHYFLNQKLNNEEERNDELKWRNYRLRYLQGIFCLQEETFFINKDIYNLFIENNAWVEKKTQIAKNIYNKKSGFAEIVTLNRIISKVRIKPGLYINIKNLDVKKEGFEKKFHKKLFFPGEKIVNRFDIKFLTYTEVIKNAKNTFLLLRIAFFYVIPRIRTKQSKSINTKYSQIYSKTFKYRDNVSFVKKKSANLIKTKLIFSNIEKSSNSVTIKSSFFEDIKNSISLQYDVFENVFNKNELFKKVDSKQFDVSLFVKDNQYIEPYTILGNIQIFGKISLKIKHLKERKFKKFRRILIISTENYKTLFTEDENLITNKKDFIKIGDLISKNIISQDSGKIEHNSGNKVKIRLAKPFLFSKDAAVFFSNNEFVQENENLGILFYKRAQTEDIVQGLPKIEEILEARKPKKELKSPKIPGLILDKIITVRIIEFKLTNIAKFVYVNKRGFKFYFIAKDQHEFFLNSNSFINSGQPINAGFTNPHVTINYLNSCYKKFLNPYEAAYRSLRKIQSYVLNSVQKIYYSQGVIIADTHLEIIIKQMTSKIKITDRGGSGISLGEYINLKYIYYIDKTLKKTKAKKTFYRPVVLGITKASLITESFISAASFQETVRVLTAAAIQGKVDWLTGLKETVIVGRLITAGTGFNSYEHISHLSIRLPKPDLKEQNLLEKEFNKA
jgi:DNA-directed RNA polymerase subunit beta'